MAGLRRNAALVCSWALLAAASYVRNWQAFSVAPLLESQAPSQISCAAFCRREADCVGFSFTANSSCQLFDHVIGSTTSSGGSTAVRVHYIRPLAKPCPSGWHLHGFKCYRWEENAGGLMTWQQAKQACMDWGHDADLAVPNSKNKTVWFLHHPSRPWGTAYVGLKTESGDLFKADGTLLLYGLPMVNGHDDPGCVCLRNKYNTETWAARTCDTGMKNGLCESSRHCLSGSPCPRYWLALDDYCFHYSSVAKTSRNASQYCSELRPIGALLASVSSVNMWTIVDQMSGTPGTRVHAGPPAVSSTSQPNDTAGDVVCTVIGAHGTEQVSCSEPHPFFCQLPVGLC